MTAEQEKKYWFVRIDLLHLLQKIDKDILSAEYQIIGPEEFVEIVWLYHETGRDFHKKIHITADNLKALTIDVLCHI